MTLSRALPICGLFLVFGASIAWGQSNTVLDTILSSKKATYGEAAYLALTATKRIPDSATLSLAAVELEAQKWGISFTTANEPVTLGDYCYIIMKAFDMKGGIMYHLFPGPRYAARQIAYLGLVPGNTSPYRPLSGREAVDIIGNVLRYEERS